MEPLAALGPGLRAPSSLNGHSSLRHTGLLLGLSNLNLQCLWTLLGPTPQCKSVSSATFLALPLQAHMPHQSNLGLTGFLVCYVAFLWWLGMSACMTYGCSWTWLQCLTVLPRLASYSWFQEILLPPKYLDNRYVPPCWLENRFDQRHGPDVLSTSNSQDNNILSVHPSWTMSNSGGLHEDTVTLRTWLS